MMSELGSAVVTGAGRGIGAAIAKALGVAGWSVGVNFLRDATSADTVAEEIRSRGGKAFAYGGDASNAAEMEALFDRVEADLGPIRLLVNNAGVITSFQPLIEMDPDEVRRVVEINTLGPLVCSAIAVRRMARSRGGQGGAILNISSLAALSGGARVSLAYAATKGALNTLTLGLAREYGREGIRVNAIMPGLIPTDIHGAAGTQALMGKVPAIPLGRLGTVEDCARTVAWLASAEADYISGAIIPVAGGM